jgi:hypothetical protein
MSLSPRTILSGLAPPRCRVRPHMLHNPPNTGTIEAPYSFNRSLDSTKSHPVRVAQRRPSPSLVPHPHLPLHQGKV